MTNFSNFDTNGDQIIDQTGYDTDADQRIDTWYIDKNQDSVADEYVVDSNRDGVGDVRYFDNNQDGTRDSTAPEVAEDLSAWFPQSTTFTCGPAAATQILEDFTGRDYVNENELWQYAHSQGWMTDRGMSIYHLDDLLTLYGVPAHVEVAGYDATTAFETVDSYIEAGRAVVLFVDSSEYLSGTDGDTYHFVRIVDVDMERGVAVLSDSATANGRGLEVPLATLAAAWEEGAEGQGSLSFNVVLTDVVDPDGVARQAERTNPKSAFAPGEPLALLPITITSTGFARLAAR